MLYEMMLYDAKAQLQQTKEGSSVVLKHAPARCQAARQ